MSECVASSSAAFDRDRGDDDSESRQSQLRRAFASTTTGIVGPGHPVNEVRVEKLREELHRWRTERQRVLAKLQAKRGSVAAADSERS